MAMSVVLSVGEHVPWDLGRTAGTQAQSRVTNTSHRTPAMAGPSDGWLALGCVWVCCSPHVSKHYCYVNVIIIRNIIFIVYHCFTRVSRIESLNCLLKI